MRMGVVRAVLTIPLVPWVVACGEGENGGGPAVHEGADGGTEEKLDPPEACTVAAECRGCSSCEALCECGGGTPDECSDECASEPPPMTTHTSDPPPPPKQEPGGSTVLTLVTEDFEVAPGEETYRCQGFGNPFGRDVAIIESRSSMPSGSHHMFVFQGNFETTGLERCGGLEFGPSVHSSQRSEELMTYPEGVGRFLGARDSLRIQVHYLNTTSEPIHAYVATTLRAVELEQVDSLASHVFINTINISVPPQSSGQASTSCSIPYDANLLSASSHMHQFGVYFQARDAQGQLVYETNEWAEPEPWRFEPSLFLAAGNRIDIRCDYENTTNEALSFGESAKTNEMCILSGFYYPAPGGEGISCLF